MVTAFEVFEHLEQPSTELDEVFSLNPALLVASTALFEGQGPDWGYLGPAKSEHVFFYSRRALELIAERYQYRVLILKNDLIVFYRADTSVVRLKIAAALLARNYLSEVLFAIIRKKSYAESDNRLIREKISHE
jgi:hypothetical protein